MRLELVPSERQVEALARHGQRVATLRELISDLAARAAAGRERAGPEVTRLIAEKAASEPELAELLDSGVGALRQLGVTQQQLSTLPGTRAKLFAATLERADTALERAQLRDERGDVWLAASAVDESVLQGITEISVVAWARLSAGELRLLERLHQLLRGRGGGVSVRFPGLSGDESRRAVEDAQARLEARWASENDAPAILCNEERAASKLSLRCVRAPNATSEARAAVRAVQERLSAGGRLDRIAIVPLEMSEAFLEELRSALWAARLPFSEPRGRPPIAGPNVHATLELLRLVGGPIRRDALLDVLAAPGLRSERWFGPDGRRALHVLREILARTPVGFDRSGELLLERAVSIAERRGEPVADQAAAGLSRIIDDLRRLAGPRTRAELVRAFSDLVEELGLLRLSARTLGLALAERDAGSPGLLTALSDDARGTAALSVAMGRLVEAAARLDLGREQVTPHQLSTELTRAMAGVGQARGAARAAAIAIARPAEVAGLQLDLAVVCRASAACFAKTGAHGAALTLGHELCEALPRQQRPATARDAEAATLVALNALLYSAERCELIWSTSDGTSETREARFVESLARAQPALRTLDEPGSSLAPGARRIVALKPASSDVTTRAQVELERQAYFFEHGTLGALTGQVSELSGWVDPGLPPLPVTKLERYADCAFLGFSSIVLRTVRDESVTDALGARERGVLIHAAVAEALSAIAGRLDRPEEELLPEALAAAARSLSAHTGSALRGAALRMTLADVRSFVRWSLQNRELGFRYAEKSFGDAERDGWSPLELGPYRVSGRIDRIDVSADGQRVRVIDYKSGQAPSKKEWHALQGWLYAHKVATELGASQVQSLYLGLRRRVAFPKPVFEGAPDAPELQERLYHARRALEQLRSGLIPAAPSRPSKCARCDTRDICRRPLSAPVAEDNGDES
ncbi:MAG TPA: PD-(D/E)XK nuclease family protein [Polyangiaceae bacterium]|nr:PD-(D/E)XK nuclease family protein [Polyangiaceae bacterium]